MGTEPKAFHILGKCSAIAQAPSSPSAFSGFNPVWVLRASSLDHGGVHKCHQLEVFAWRHPWCFSQRVYLYARMMKEQLCDYMSRFCESFGDLSSSGSEMPQTSVDFLEARDKLCFSLVHFPFTLGGRSGHNSMTWNFWGLSDSRVV